MQRPWCTPVCAKHQRLVARRTREPFWWWWLVVWLVWLDCESDERDEPSRCWGQDTYIDRLVASSRRPTGYLPTRRWIPSPLIMRDSGHGGGVRWRVTYRLATTCLLAPSQTVYRNSAFKRALRSSSTIQNKRDRGKRHLVGGASPAKGGAKHPPPTARRGRSARSLQPHHHSELHCTFASLQVAIWPLTWRTTSEFTSLPCSSVWVDVLHM